MYKIDYDLAFHIPFSIPSPFTVTCQVSHLTYYSTTNLTTSSDEDIFFRSLLSFPALAIESKTPFPGCKWKETYQVRVIDLLENGFGSRIPETGLVGSPFVGAPHCNPISFIKILGYVFKAVEQIAETGVNARFIHLAKRLPRRTRNGTSFPDADAQTMPGNFTTMTLSITIHNPFFTVIVMIAPSSDWIVQINSINTVDSAGGGFIRYESSTVIAYDSGVDDGIEIKPPLYYPLILSRAPTRTSFHCARTRLTVWRGT